MKKTTKQTNNSPFKEIRQEEIDFLEGQVRKIDQYRKSKDTPDHVGFEYHSMVLAISNLRAQERLEKLTWVLIGLTVVLASLTLILVLKELLL